MSSIDAQAYLFFYLNVEGLVCFIISSIYLSYHIYFSQYLLLVLGWRVSAEHQVSDMELQKLNAHSNNSNADTNNSVTLDNMKEAAYSIYEQYLSERVIVKIILIFSIEHVHGDSSLTQKKKI